MVFLFGVIGFAGFEGLRIYKCLWAGQTVLPVDRKYFYFCVIVVVAVFSGAVSTVLSHGSLGSAIYIGFSVPTGIKALLEGPRSTRQPSRARSQDNTDDIVLSTPGFRDYVSNHYFAFR